MITVGEQLARLDPRRASLAVLLAFDAETATCDVQDADGTVLEDVPLTRTTTCAPLDPGDRVLLFGRDDTVIAVALSFRELAVDCAYEDWRHGNEIDPRNEKPLPVICGGSPPELDDSEAA